MIFRLPEIAFGVAKKITVIASIAVKQCVRNLTTTKNGNAEWFSGNPFFVIARLNEVKS
ncbi:MAG: hypothetical protein IKI11_02870 [Neisseriaceae bacterium]|nr:hypothetical protein [Neisseriaceae bacterium]